MDAEHANNGLCLPYDLLLDILRRLPGRALAASRCVCRGWRDIVDFHALLLPHVFPRKFPGIFASYKGYDPRFGLFGPLARAADQPAYRRLYWESWTYCVKQHCNGLLLFTGDRPTTNPYVCNPATSRYACLPYPPTQWWCGVEGMFLAFDPTVSRHYEVFFFPVNKQQYQEKQRQWSSTKGGNEKIFDVLVFSSQTWQWESQEFRPRHSGSGHLYDVVTAPRAKDEKIWWSAEYWHGSLYVHCHSGVLMILCCTERTYDMTQLPGQPSDNETVYQLALPTRYLASNDRGIRYALINEFQLEVWELMESAYDPLGWTLAHEANLKELDHKINYLREEESVQPRMQWAVVDSKKDLISLFDYGDEESSDGCDYGTENDGEGEEFDDYSNEERNDDCDDGTESDEEGKEEKEQELEVEVEEEDKYDMVPEQEEEKQYNDDETQGEDEEKQNNDDEIQGKGQEERDKNDDDEDEELASSVGSDYSWDSDQHNFIDFDKLKIPEENVWGWGCTIIGFHPYKDVLLLKFSDTVMAYHFHTSRMQYLGYVYPYNHHQQAREIHLTFPYRPCYVDDLPSREAPRSS